MWLKLDSIATMIRSLNLACARSAALHREESLPADNSQPTLHVLATELQFYPMPCMHIEHAQNQDQRPCSAEALMNVLLA